MSPSSLFLYGYLAKVYQLLLYPRLFLWLESATAFGCHRIFFSFAFYTKKETSVRGFLDSILYFPHFIIHFHIISVANSCQILMSIKKAHKSLNHANYGLFFILSHLPCFLRRNFVSSLPLKVHL